jgi:hypothetical protein
MLSIELPKISRTNVLVHTHDLEAGKISDSGGLKPGFFIFIGITLEVEDG